MLTSKLQYSWDGSPQELKSFVYGQLGLIGKWSSPGGEVKLFVNSNVSFKRYGPTQKRLVILKDDHRQPRNAVFYVYVTSINKQNTAFLGCLWDDKENSLIKALKEHAIYESDSVELCSAEQSQVDTSCEKLSCESCRKLLPSLNYS